MAARDRPRDHRRMVEHTARAADRGAFGGPERQAVLAVAGADG